MDADADGFTDDGRAAKSDQPKRSMWRPQWKPPNGQDQLLPQDSSPALEGGSPLVALMPAVRANSFEWLPAHPPAPAPAPVPAPAPAPVLLNHFVWNDAGRSVAQTQPVQRPLQRHYVESLRTTVAGMSATLLHNSDHSIHTQPMQFSDAPAAINKGTKAKEKEPESKFKWKPLKIAKTR